MSTSTSQMPLTSRSNLNAAVRQRFVQIGLLVVIQAVALFASAGSLNWLAAWVYMLVYVGFIAVNALTLLPRHKDLIAERAEIKEDVPGWDKLILLLTAILGIAILVVAGLDYRFDGSPYIQREFKGVALIVMMLGDGLFSWAMTSNIFFSATVRVQEDRNHFVVTSGPYRYVRHPGYVGLVAFTLATPVLLGSLWAFVPALLLVLAIVIRTSLEDTTLQKELNGYSEYAKQVRYRLLPGIW